MDDHIKIGVREVILGKGGEATDYNSLSNLPIKNLSGPNADDVVDLSVLDTGNYSLTGFYKIGDDTYTTDIPLNIAVNKDEDTTYIYFLEQLGRIVYLYTIEFFDGSLVTFNKQSLTPDYESLINLPQVNDETLIGNKTAEDLGLASQDDVEGIKQDIGDVELLLSLL